jgi:hypothetical protein
VIFGDSLPALRVLPAAAAAMTVVLTPRSRASSAATPGHRDRRPARDAGDRSTSGRSPILTPNAFDVVVWTAVLLAVIRLLASPSSSGWTALGVLLGVGLLNRQGVVFLIAGAADRAGAHAGTPPPRLARTLDRGAIVGLFVAPNLLWQATHGWRPRKFADNARRLK